MQLRWLTLVITTTVVISITYVMFGFALRKYESGSANENLHETHMTFHIGLDLGPGMGPDLMSARSFEPDESLIDFSKIEFDGEAGVGQTLTRRFMSAMIAGEGCKSYVDYGEGIWVPIDETMALKNDATTENPFEGTDPFE